jgi:hypothetical protein
MLQQILRIIVIKATTLIESRGKIMSIPIEGKKTLDKI